MQANTVRSDNWLKVSTYPGARMSEGCSLFLLKLVSMILKPTLVNRSSFKEITVKEWCGGSQEGFWRYCRFRRGESYNIS